MAPEGSPPAGRRRTPKTARRTVNRNGFSMMTFRRRLLNVGATGSAASPADTAAFRGSMFEKGRPVEDDPDVALDVGTDRHQQPFSILCDVASGRPLRRLQKGLRCAGLEVGAHAN